MVGEELSTAVAPACPPREAHRAQSSSKPTCPWITSNENGPGLDFRISSEKYFFVLLGSQSIGASGLLPTQLAFLDSDFSGSIPE